MPDKITFSAEPRQLVGKKTAQLRRASLVPASINGDLDKTILIQVPQNKLDHLYKQVGDTGLFYITVTGDKTERPVLVSELQRDPISNQIIHALFRQVSLSEKVHAEVPVEVIGELGVKNALIVTVHDNVEVSAFPQDLPEKFIIDASKLTKLGQMITFADLDFDKTKVTLIIEEDQLNTPVVIAQEIKEVVEEAPVVEAAPAEGAAAAVTPEDATKAADKAPAAAGKDKK